MFDVNKKSEIIIIPHHQSTKRLLQRQAVYIVFPLSWRPRSSVLDVLFIRNPRPIQPLIVSPLIHDYPLPLIVLSKLRSSKLRLFKCRLRFQRHTNSKISRRKFVQQLLLPAKS